MKDLAGAPLTGQLGKTFDALLKLSDAELRAPRIRELFGRMGPGLMPAILKGSAGLELTRERLERFGLTVHNDSRPLPVFVLTAGSGKHKLKVSDGAQSGCQGIPQGAPQPGVIPYQQVACKNLTTEQIATNLRQMAGGYLDKPVIDEVKLSGAWDFDLKWTARAQPGDEILADLGTHGQVLEVMPEIRAITLKVNNESRLAEAIDSVRVSRDTLQARADYGLFDDNADRGWLLGHPRAWDDETTVTGDTLEIWTENAKGDKTTPGEAIVVFN